uniref:Reverse transcriptase domain-containing protein n=1 Tax=Nicotiana tabacum TaxID=4097 RepID=A0A1S4BPG7_TOBAC|nr:PREDICTED: uncharacterized protein LOC107810475 [Nicotiana tabacum]
MEMNARQDTNKTYFKFLNCWVENEGFIPLVHEVWNEEVRGNPMWIFHQNLKAISNALSKWLRQENGDFFQKVKKYKEKVKHAEMTWAQTNDVDGRINFQEWFKDGDADSRYFNRLMRGRRRKLFIHKIKDLEGEWVQGDEAIVEAACDYYQDLFIETCGIIREVLLSYIPSFITDEENDLLTRDPTIEELNEVIFSMNPTSTAGPDCMNGKEIVQGIKKPNKGTNVVIKLDMAKAYDRVSWSFTCIMLRRMGFNERIIDMIWKTMSNNWYSVIINGTRCDFFHSTRGLKQGDLLAPSLFIIGAELLFRMLNKLTHDKFFNGFYMEKRGPQVKHLSFADDIIIFTSGGRASL